MVKRRAPEIAQVIHAAATDSTLEADFRRLVEEALARFADEVGVPLRTHREYTLATGRTDTVYNRLVIEYKRPGHLCRWFVTYCGCQVQREGGRFDSSPLARM